MRLSSFRGPPQAGAGLGPVFFAILLFIESPGCAPKPLLRLPPNEHPLKIYVKPVEEKVHIKRLKYIEEVPRGLGEEEEPPLIAEKMGNVRKDLHDRFSRSLGSSTLFVTTSPDHADLEVDIKLEAYGRVPSKWLVYLLGTGVIEGLVQGYVVERVTRNKWIAIAVASEEILQEGVTWLGGAFLTNRYLTPVILSVRIVRTGDQKKVLSHHVFAVYSHRVAKGLPEEERAKRPARLHAVAQRATDDLSTYIERSWRKLNKRRFPKK